MPLTAVELFAKKKRIMDALDERPERDIKLAIDTFSMWSPSDWSTKENLIEETISSASGSEVEQLYEALFKKNDSTEPPIADLLDDEDNTPFSELEQERIADVLNELKRQATETYGLPEAELQALNAKIDYLVEAAKHSRRKDWLLLAVTVVSQPFVDGVLTPDVVHKVFSAIEVGLGAMFGHPVLLLGR
jgi:hypothetical protein